jgi:hypothetical protein
LGVVTETAVFKHQSNRMNVVIIEREHHRRSDGGVGQVNLQAAWAISPCGFRDWDWAAGHLSKES